MKNLITLAAGIGVFFLGAWAEGKYGVRGKTKERLDKAKDYVKGLLKKEDSAVDKVEEKVKEVVEEAAEEVKEVVEEVKKAADDATE